MRLAIIYKNFGAVSGLSHIGLGVSAINICKSLRQQGLRAEVWGCVSLQDIQKKISQTYAQNDPVTHVSICALWLKSAELRALVDTYPETQFVVNCHSNVGFLQAEPQAIGLIREAIQIEQTSHNFRMAGNSQKFCNWVKHAYGAPCLWLPNLYYLTSTTPINKPVWSGGTLKIGCFGAMRVYKNFSTAVAAATQIARHLKAVTEVWVNSGRDDGLGSSAQSAIVQLTKNLPNVTLKQWPWSSWPEFKELIATMNLLLQPSYTESFNIVTADGIALGVPSVVSSAIEWAPADWIVNNDDASAIEKRGIFLIRDTDAGTEGMTALVAYNAIGLTQWKSFLL